MSTVPLSVPSLTVSEFAELHELSPRTVYRLIQAGEIPHFTLGRSIRIPSGALAPVQP